MVDYLLGEGGRNITGRVLTTGAGNTPASEPLLLPVRSPGAASPPLISLKRRMTIFGESRPWLHGQRPADVI